MVEIQEGKIESKLVWSGDAALRRDLVLGLARTSLPGPTQLPRAVAQCTCPRGVPVPQAPARRALLEML